MADFKVTIVDTVIDLLKTNLGSAIIKGYFYGDPWVIPQSNLPAICVFSSEGESPQDATGMDMEKNTLIIRVVYNKKLDFNKAPNEVVAQRSLEQIVKARDLSTGERSQSSVVGILRKNFTMGVGVDDQTIRWRFIEGKNRPPDLITAEAEVFLDTSEIIAVSSRV